MLHLFILDGNLCLIVSKKKIAGDLNETYFVGNVDEVSQKLVRCTYECLEKAISIGMCWFLPYVKHITFN